MDHRFDNAGAKGHTMNILTNIPTDIGSIEDAAHRASAIARPAAEAVADAVTGAASAAMSGVENVLSSSPNTVAATSAITAGAAKGAFRIAAKHPYFVAAAAAVLAIGVYAGWRRRAAEVVSPPAVNPYAVRSTDVRAAA